MKYLVVVSDGAADYPCDGLNGLTPYEAADKPYTDMLAKGALCGTVSNVPEGMVPESDTANLAILSYDPKIYSKGRSPHEALSMGLDMKPGQIAFRCNVVTVSEEGDYDQRTMLDHSADEITTAEAAELIKAVDEKLGTELRKFYPGVSYRHCLLWDNPPAYKEFARPHDIIGQKITDYLPPEPYATLFRESEKILKDHPVNQSRRARGLKPANSIWLWSPGAKPALPSFKEKWGLEGAVISAVDLLKGIGICAGMRSIDVEGATGNVHTNYEGKANAAIKAFEDGYDLVYVHVEGPDESGHRAELDNKVKSISMIDKMIIGPVYEYLKTKDERFAIMTLPDHPTPICKRTHTIDPVPFLIWDSEIKRHGVEAFNEKTAAATGLYVPNGYELLSEMIEKK